MILIILALFIYLTCGNTFADEEQISLVIYSYTNELQNLIERYYQPNHPEISFYYQIYPTDGGAYEAKLDSVLMSDPTASDAPDIFMLEGTFAKKYINSNVTGNLNSIGFSEQDYSSVYPAVLETGTDQTTQQQKALSWMASPTVMFYRASLAEKYLGVKTPEQFAEKVKDYTSFLNTARELKVASEGACKIITGIYDLTNIDTSDAVAWIRNGQLMISTDRLSLAELARAIEEEDLSQKGNAWSEIWFAGMRGECETLTYILPMWGLNHTIMPNCVAGWDAANPDSIQNISNAVNNGTYGDWRVVTGPSRSNWGGTWITTNRKKVDDANFWKKEAIKNLISFLTLNQNFLTQYAEESGDFVSNMEVMENLAEQESQSMDFLGGQNPLSVFDEAAQLTHTTYQTEYDNDLNRLWSDYVLRPYMRGEVDLETAIEDFKGIVEQNFPDFSEINSPAILILSIRQYGYQEKYILNVDNPKYFVLPLNTEAHFSLELRSSCDGDETTYEIQGDAIQIENSIISAVKTGKSTINAWIESGDEVLSGAHIQANIVVIDPQKTITIPNTVTWLETEAFNGIDAECIIFPSGLWVIESSCFANCPNLKTVIWLGDPSTIRVSSPFSSPESILFLSNNGLLPSGMTSTNVGTTSFSGFQ